ncbi:MFS transporter [Rubrobacter marinus]|uniref:Putative proline/betaine transporter n=1 Tax=Rubrobacter marinus TaxID=2653852 RepID=A0A6G8PWF1_9ACTN|nr:MFS transporter [Rubrobacter marinus]QIN78530.1 MFS transporter [Rubrobacter marinus]
MEALGGEHTGERTSVRQVVTASLVGTTIEWYDFFIYGTAAALIFNQLFFPGSEPLTGTLLAFGTYAVGFAARPLGGIFCGHFGDKIGRKSMLVMTLVVMGIATFAIGLLPTYAAIGVWAPILLVVLRFLQGFAVGGEWGGATLMAVEYAPPGRRGFYGAWPGMGIPAGLVLATAVFSLFQTLPEEQFLAWGWRAPFLLSIILVAVGLFIRLKILETPAFERVRESSGGVSRLPIVEVLRNYWRSILLTMGAFFLLNGGFYIAVTFMLTYGTQTVGVENSTMLTGVLIAACVQIVAIGFFGALSDKLGRRPVYLGGAIFLGLFSFPLFWMVNTGNAVVIWLALTLAVASLGAMYGPMGAFFSELFDTRVRYSGASLGYQAASVFAGGLAPFIGIALLSRYGYPAVALYMIGMAVITIVAVYLATETYQRDLNGDDNDAEQQGVAGRNVVRG